MRKWAILVIDGGGAGLVWFGLGVGGYLTESVTTQGAHAYFHVNVTF